MEIVQTGTVRFMPGKLYWHVYNVLLNNQTKKQSKVKVKCLKEREGKYLFQRADGLQYWISHEDAGYLLDGDPCTDEDF